MAESRQYLIQGQGYINETGDRQYLIPGFGYENETILTQPYFLTGTNQVVSGGASNP